jgi:hypothetical protein
VKLIKKFTELELINQNKYFLLLWNGILEHVFENLHQLDSSSTIDTRNLKQGDFCVKEKVLEDPDCQINKWSVFGRLTNAP